MKITYSQENIKSFGGINFVNHILTNASIFEIIDENLKSRANRATYAYSDLFKSYLYLSLCGGECAEDISEHLRSELNQVKGFQAPSADTLFLMQKELATKKITFRSKSDIEHDFNINIGMNKLMVKLLVATKQLSPSVDNYVFDYDNQFIPTGKYDSKRSYKKGQKIILMCRSIRFEFLYLNNKLFTFKLFHVKFHNGFRISPVLIKLFSA